MGCRVAGFAGDGVPRPGEICFDCIWRYDEVLKIIQVRDVHFDPPAPGMFWRQGEQTQD